MNDWVPYKTQWQAAVQKSTAESMFTPQELDHMRAMLDDPDVSPAVKNNFLYALSNAGRLSNEEIDRYAPQVGADADDVRSGGEALDENMVNARTALRTASRENAQGDTNRGHEALNQGGFSTSDEIIDEAELALKLFEDFYPRYQEASGLVGSAAPAPTGQQEYDVVTVDTSAGQGAEGGAGMGGAASYSHSGNDPHSIRNGLDEFRGIEFTAFRADADMLSKAHSSVNDGRDALESAWGSNTGDWTGDAKSAAEQVNNALVKGSGDLSQALRTAPDNLTAGIDAVQENVVNFAHRTLDVYGNGTVADLTPEQVDSFIRTVKELPPVIADLKAKIQEIENKGFWDKFVDIISNPFTLAVSIVSPISAIVGYSIASEITEDNIREETAKLEGILAESEAKLAEFCAAYDQKASEFHSHASTFVSAIDAAYSETIKLLGEGLEPDPFAEAEKGKGGDKGGGDTGRSGVGGGGGPSGGGGGPSGGGGGPSGGGSIPGMGGPETGTDGTNPVTGEPLEVNPETGEPYPIDPETGEAIKDLDGREKLTVEQGDQKFTMTEPNDDGEMGITVEDGAGELSEYRLDFSEEDAEGAEGEKAGESDFGPQGSEQGTSDKVYRPGPDGKIHIEDGNLKITAEQPKGPDGPTVVTVDNGEGEPVTYTLGDTDSPESLLDEEVTTQPAEADPAQDPRNFDRTQGGPDSAGGDGGGAPNGSPVSEESSASGDSAGGGAETGSNAAAAPAPAEGLESPGPSGETADSDSSSATHAAAVSDGGGGGSSSAGGGGGSDLGSSSDDTQPGGRTSSMSAGGGLATAPGGEGMAAQGGGASSAGAGGAGMMGGMGAMGGGGGGGQGGDQERSSSYRVDGDIFGAIAPETVRLSGSLADAPDVPVRFTR